MKKEKQIGGRWIISLLRIIIYTRLELLFDLLQIKTVKVSNVSLGATERGIKEFFSFSGDIEYVEMKSDNERTQIAYVTFKDMQGAETAVLLSVKSLYYLVFSLTYTFTSQGATVNLDMFSVEG